MWRIAAPFLACLFLLNTPCLSQENPEPAERGPEFLLRDVAWNLKQFGSYHDYWKFVSSQGYTGVDIEVVDVEGGFYLFSPTLENFKWYQQPDALSGFLRELDDHEKFPRGKEMVVSLNISAISRRESSDRKFTRYVRRIPARDMGDLANDLQHYYDITDLTSESYTDEIQNAMQLRTDMNRKKLNMIVTSPGFEDYIFSYASYDKKFTRAPDRFIIRDRFFYPLNAGRPYFPSMGLGDLAAGLARTLGKEVWVSCGSGQGFPPYSEHNVFLYRTVQYSPEGYLMLPNPDNSYVHDPEVFDFEKTYKKDIIKFHRKFGEGRKKPIANLVLGDRRKRRVMVPEYIEPVTNALLANGYDIRVTFAEFLKKADLYYVVGGDDWLDNSSFFDDLLNLLDYRKSRFYGTVVLHPMGKIVRRSRWMKIRRMFRIPDSEEGGTTEIPESVTIRGRAIQWKGNVPSENFGMTLLRAENITANNGDVVLKQLVGSQTLALILRAGSHYLINGNFLHLEASYFISRLVGGSLQVPTMAYVTSGKDRTAVLAVDETRLKLKIPTPDVAKTWRVYHYDPRGRLQKEEVMEGSEVFETTLKPFELVILESEKED